MIEIEKLKAKKKAWKKAAKRLNKLNDSICAEREQVRIENEKLKEEVSKVYEYAQKIEAELDALRMPSAVDKIAVEHNIDKSKKLITATLEELKTNHEATRKKTPWRLCYDCGTECGTISEPAHDIDADKDTRGTVKACGKCFKNRKRLEIDSAVSLPEPPVGEIGLPEPVMPIVNSFRDMGVKLSLQGDKVAISGPESKCTDEVIEMVRKDKQKIIAELSGKPTLGETPRKKLSPGVF